MRRGQDSIMNLYYVHQNLSGRQYQVRKLNTIPLKNKKGKRPKSYNLVIQREGKK